MKKWIVMMVVLLGSLRAEQLLFTPPEGWGVADPAKYSQRTQIMFLGPTKKKFLPSINLVIEEDVHHSLRGYMKILRKEYMNKSEYNWKELSTMKTAAGTIGLTELESMTNWGPARFLQSILIRDKKAYIITVAALKEEFDQFYEDFEKVFQSLRFTDDLMKCLSTEEREPLGKMAEALIATSPKFKSGEEMLNDTVYQKEKWLPYQEKVCSQKKQGTYWQVLMLKETQEKILIDR